MASKKEEKNKPKSDGYGAEQIQVLEGLEPVRKRPGMYIGGTGEEGLHHLIWEIVDNSIDEAMAGYASQIEVTVHEDESVTVKDNGRGIPVELHKQTKKSTLETVLTVLHAGGKFGGGGYKVSGGLHGVGVSVVNALSDRLRAEVHKEGAIYVQEYKRGKPTGAVKQVGKTKDSGTRITFHPDPEIFGSELKFSWETILDHLRQQAYLTKGVSLKIADERVKPELQYGFYFEGGIKSYVEHLNKHKDKINDLPFYVEKESAGTMVEIAIQYFDGFNENIRSFANNIYNPEGGTHLTGFRAAITRTINSYARKNSLIKDTEGNLTGEDVTEGLAAIISVKLTNPQFEGQTKAKLGNPEVRTAVEAVLNEYFSYYMDENPTAARSIINKCILTSRARIAAKAARDTVIRKGALEGMTLPGKLADCASKDASQSEVYIVEGDSAGGSAKQGRDRHFQAILPLRGKILNVERARMDVMLASEQIKNLIIALGTGIGETFDAARIRYHRVIIMTDADVDGAHIRTLLLTFFYRHMKPIIDAGYLYIAQPPLYKIAFGPKEKHYAYTEVEKEQILKDIHERWAKNKGAKKGKDAEDLAEGREIPAEQELVEPAHEVDDLVAPLRDEEGTEEAVHKNAPNINIQRYKGLGEMNPEQLWETTMDPKNRVLLRVTLHDASEADELFSMLMGDEVGPRKKFIQTHAKAVQNLDI